MDRFYFFFKRSFRYENDNEKNENETIVLKTIVFFMEIVLKKWSFLKTIVFNNNRVVSLTIVNDKPSLTIFNDKPSLTIVNKERRREETDLKGMGTYH